MRIVLATVLALGFGLLFWAGADAQDKGKEVKITGQVICAKCGLAKEKTCMTTVVEKKDGKDIIYYFDKDSHKKWHDDICGGAKDGTVTGTVTEKDGKKTIMVTNVEYKK
jgi:uncharacterized protein (DUF2147 family)